MSVETCPTDTMPPCMDDVILPRAHDIVGFEVRRALPARSGKMVGPFIFFDQMGPGEFLTGRGLDVRPHPHIGLSTVTYLFDGAIQHRDSLDTDQYIQSGDVNWMTAGCGITHSERTAAPARTHSNRLFGIQSWVALPKQHEEAAPDFTHHDAAALPVIEDALGRRPGLGTSHRCGIGGAWRESPNQPLSIQSTPCRRIPHHGWPIPDSPLVGTRPDKADSRCERCATINGFAGAPRGRDLRSGLG